MKRLLILLMLLFVLTGCKSKAESSLEAVFTLSSEQQEEYINLIDQTLRSFYWYYDSESLTYFKGEVPAENQEIFEASEKNGFNLRKSSGKEAVVYSCDITHFNKNKAGTSYFYFINGKLEGCYYTPLANNELQLDFKTRNVFVKGTKIKQKETNASEIIYTEFSGNGAPDGFISEGRDKNGRGLYLNIENDGISIYRFNETKFSLFKRITSFFEELIPISASFLNDGRIAVIAGGVLKENELSDETIRVSERLIFFDENFTKEENDMALSKGTYSCVAADEDRLILINDRNLEMYEEDGDGLKLVESYGIGVQGTYLSIGDIDNDGNKEYIVSDSKDLYIFRKNGINLDCIWQTNISADNFYGGIYLGDLNGDDAMEIYMADITGTAIRYTLGENGLIAANENIEYGDMFYVGDFNGDGVSDYIISRGSENPVKSVYIAEK